MIIYPDRSGINNNQWKGGRIKRKRYWYLSIPDYYRSTKQGYVAEHIYFYEQYYKVCVLKWAVVHHIDNNPENNMPGWNLKAMMKRDHNILHNIGNRYCRGKHKDFSDRRCFICGSPNTTIRRPQGRDKSIGLRWYHTSYDKNNWYCSRCYTKEISKIKKEGFNHSGKSSIIL